MDITRKILGPLISTALLLTLSFSPLTRINGWSKAKAIFAEGEINLDFDGASALAVSDSSTYHAVYPSIEVSANEKLGLVWLKLENGEGSVAYSQSDNNGRSFTTVILDVALSPQFLGDTLTVDQDRDGDHIAVVWERLRLESAPGPRRAPREILIAQSYDGGISFSEPLVIALAQPEYHRGNPRPLLPQVLVKDSYVGVFWLSTGGEFQPPNLNYAYSEDGGETFSEPRYLGGGPSFYDVDVVGQTIYYVTLEGTGEYVSFWRGTLAGDSERLEEVVSIRGQGASSPRITHSADGRIYISWSGRDFANGSSFTYLRRTVDSGGTLSEPVLLDSAPVSLRNARGRLSLEVLEDQFVIVVESRWDAGVYAYISNDGGETFSTAIPLHNTADPEAEAFFKTSVGLNNDHLWVVWDEFSRSTNNKFRLMGNHTSLPDTERFTVELTVGWNFIGLPLEPTAPYTAGSLLAEVSSQGGNCVEAARWDSEVGNWSSYIRDYSFNDFLIEPYRGYFLRCTKDSQFIFNGTPLTFDLQEAFRPESSGWYDLAIPIDNLYTAASLVREIDDKLPGRALEIERWDNGLGNWEGFISGVPLPDFAVRRGEGVMIRYQALAGEPSLSAVPPPSERKLDRGATVPTSALDISWLKVRISGGSDPSLITNTLGIPTLAYIRGIADEGRTLGTATRLTLATNDGTWTEGSGWSLRDILEEPNQQHFKTSIHQRGEKGIQIAYSERDLKVPRSDLTPNLIFGDLDDENWRSSHIDPSGWSSDVVQIVHEGYTFVFYTGAGLRMARSTNNTDWEVSLLEQPAGPLNSLDAAVNNQGVIAVATTSLSQGLYYGWSEDSGNTWTIAHVNSSEVVIGPSLAFDSKGNPFISYSAIGSGDEPDTTKIAWSPDGGANWVIKTIPQLKGGPTALVITSTDRLFLANAWGSKLYVGQAEMGNSEWAFQEVDDINSLLLGDDLDMIITPDKRLVVSYETWEPAGEFGSVISSVKLAWSDPVYAPPKNGVNLYTGWNKVRSSLAGPSTAAEVVPSINEDCGQQAAKLAITRLVGGFWETFVSDYGGVNFTPSANSLFYARVSTSCRWNPS